MNMTTLPTESLWWLLALAFELGLGAALIAAWLLSRKRG